MEQFLLVGMSQEYSERLREAVDGKENKIAEVNSGCEAILSISNSRYDYCLVDIDLKDIRWSDFVKLYEKFSPDTVILILYNESSKHDEMDLIKEGADLYVSFDKHIDLHIAYLEKGKREKAENRSLRNFERYSSISTNLSVDFNSRIVRKEDKELMLTRNQNLILKMLYRNQDRVVSRRELEELISPYSDTTNFGRAVDVQIAKLRDKIGFSRIQTVRGRGYILVVND